MACLTWEFIILTAKIPITLLEMRSASLTRCHTSIQWPIKCNWWAHIFPLWSTDGRVPAIPECITTWSRRCNGGGGLVPFHRKPGRRVSGCGESGHVSGFHYLCDDGFILACCVLACSQGHLISVAHLTAKARICIFKIWLFYCLRRRLLALHCSF